MKRIIGLAFLLFLSGLTSAYALQEYATNAYVTPPLCRVQLVPQRWQDVVYVSQSI